LKSATALPAQQMVYVSNVENQYEKSGMQRKQFFAYRFFHI
jgi:hypothetical protein